MAALTVIDRRDDYDEPAIVATPRIIEPGHAAFLLATMPYARQRSIRRGHVAALVRAIRRGELVPSSLAVAVLPDGRRLLLDGQHRLKACVESGVPIQTIVVEYPCADEAEVNRLYAGFDRGAIRTMPEALTALGAGSYPALSARDVRILATVAEPILIGFQPRTPGHTPVLRSPATRAAFIEDWAGVAATYSEQCLAGAARNQRDYLWRAAVASVALVTVRYRPEAAIPFWRSIATNDGLAKGTPAHALHYILWTKAPNGVGMPTYSRLVAACWNAHYAGRRSVRLPTAPDTSAPILIGGTPYDGSLVIIPRYARDDD